MKSYYVFIRDYEKLVPGSFIYDVAVGQSQREQVKLELLKCYCRDCGLFFELRSDTVDTAITLAKDPWCWGKNRWKNPFRRVKISIKDLYEMILDDSFTSFEASYIESQTAIHQKFHDDPRYIQWANKISRITKCPTLQRKNLSDGNYDSGVIATMAVAFILGSYAVLVFFHNVCLKLFGVV